MVAYLDLIILENLTMNYLILYTTGKILGRKIKIGRLLISSIIGAIYVFSIYINIPTFLINISKILISFLLVKVAFNSKRLKKIKNEAVLFFIVSFVYAGCALGFIHFAKPNIIYIVNGVIIGGEYIFELVLLSTIISCVLIKISMKIVKIRQKFSKGEIICEAVVINNEKQINISALVDTGNLLTDPVSKSPVIVSQLDKIEPIIPNESLVEIMYMMGGDAVKGQHAHDARIRVIPYVSVGNTNGIMIAYKVDCVKVEYQDQIYEIENALIGFCREALSKNNKYSALIGLKVLEGGNVKDESNTDIEKSSECSIC